MLKRTTNVGKEQSILIRRTMIMTTNSRRAKTQMDGSVDFQLKSITARSRRKRRPFEKLQQTQDELSVNTTTTTTATTTNLHDVSPASYEPNSSTSKASFQQHRRVGKFSTVLTYAALLVLSATCTSCTNSPCEYNNWWDPVRDSCIPCTSCEGDMIPLRPCQLHRDTICGSIYDLKIDWVVLAKTEPNWKERRKSDDINYNMEQQLTHEEVIQLDWQTAALFMAVLACLLFFIVAACILIHHMRQWRRMERRLDQDVEELSTKLMAKLAEVHSLEGGTFFIGNADALRIPATFQPQHVLLPEKPTGKHQERRILKTLQPGNVYIEESSSKG